VQSVTRPSLALPPSLGRWADRHFRLLLVLPALLLLAALVAYPLLYLAGLSVQNITLANIAKPDRQEFVGVANFAYVFGDSGFFSTIRNTAVFAGASIAIELAIGLALGLLFTARFRGRRALMILMLVPILMTPVVIGLFWKLLLNGEWGVVNYLIGLVGLPEQSWLADPNLAMASVVLVFAWGGLSFVTLVVLGAVESQPVDLHEAARVDGAGYFQTLRFVTLPLLKPALLVIVLILAIDALKQFDIIYVLTGGGPGGLTRVYSLEIYDQAFRRSNFSQAAAEALVLVGLTLILVAGLVRALRRSVGALSR
jgi:multiple sugar transport system permease protein